VRLLHPERLRQKLRTYLRPSEIEQFIAKVTRAAERLNNGLCPECELPVVRERSLKQGGLWVWFDYRCAQGHHYALCEPPPAEAAS
jgi:hypothetical protein